MKTLYALILVTISLFWISCFGKTEENNAQNNNNEQSISFADPSNDTLPSLAIDSSATQGVPAQELKECLLPSFKGKSKVPSGSGRVLINGVTVTKTTGEYIYPQGTVTITLSDYAGAVKEVSSRYEMPGEETGVEIQKLILPNGYGYSRYSPNEDMMNIYCLLEGRIAAEIIANGTEVWFKDHTQLMGLIPSDCLGRKVQSQKK